MATLAFFVWVIMIVFAFAALQKALAAEASIYWAYCDKIEDQERNLYTVSTAHQLLMERVRIQDMEQRDDCVPMHQQFQLEVWYEKVAKYSYTYFQSLDNIEASIANDCDNKIVNLNKRIHESAVNEWMPQNDDDAAS